MERKKINKLLSKGMIWLRTEINRVISIAMRNTCLKFTIEKN